MTKYRDTYRIESTRLQHWDYGWNGHYFITICTARREHFFGKIQNHRMFLSQTGKMAHHFWRQIPIHFPFILLDEFVIMPNHMHGILTIDKQDEYDNGDGVDVAGGNGGGDGWDDGNGGDNVETRQCLVSTDTDTGAGTETGGNTHQNMPKTPGQKRFRNQGKHTISSIIGSYKSIVTRHARKINPNFGWQSRFHDHIIRNETSYRNIRQYIIDNPKRWKSDGFYW